MPNIFICYRRDDSNAISHRIHEFLAGRYGSESVLIDDDTIPLSVDYTKFLDEALSGSHILLVIIGKDWLRVKKNGVRRLDDPDDPVRVEIEAALARDVAIIPVLAGRTPRPEKAQLPPSISGLALRQGSEVDEGSRFRADMDELSRRIDRDIGGKGGPFKRPGLWTQIGSGLLQALEKRATSTRQEVTVPSAPSLPFNLNGVWRSSLGVDYRIEQSGSSLSLTGSNAGVIVSRGQGRVTGDRIELTLEVNYPPVVAGRGSGQVLDLGRRMVVDYQDSWVGTSRVDLTRVG